MIGDENYQKVTEDINESYIIPNKYHPFDHFIVNYIFQVWIKQSIFHRLFIKSIMKVINNKYIYKEYFIKKYNYANK